MNCRCKFQLVEELVNGKGHKLQRLSVKTWTLLLYLFLKGAMLIDNEKLSWLVPATLLVDLSFGDILLHKPFSSDSF